MNYSLLIDKVKAWDKPDDPIWIHGEQFNKQSLLQHLENLQKHAHLEANRSSNLGSWQYVVKWLPREWLEEAKCR